MIGNDIPALVRTARELQQHPIAAVDLNLGCPAPVVYRKCAGGGLLREPGKVDAILGALREAVELKFTVKTRIGFDDPTVFDELLPSSRSIRSTCSPSMAAPWRRCIGRKSTTTTSPAPSRRCPAPSSPTATFIPRPAPPPCCRKPAREG